MGLSLTGGFKSLQHSKIKTLKLIVNVNGIVGATSQGLRLYDPNDGSEVVNSNWPYDISGDFRVLDTDADNNIYTYDRSGDKVLKLDSDANLQWSYTFNENLNSIHVAPDGNVYFVDNNGVLTKLDSNGNLVWNFTAGPQLTEAIVDNNNDIIIGEGGEIVKLDQSRTELWRVDPTEGSVYDLVVDSNNNIYAAMQGSTSAVYIKYTSSGSQVFKKSIISQSVARAIDIDENEDVYVIHGSNFSRDVEVYKYTNGGNDVVWQAFPFGLPDSNPSDVAAVGDGGAIGLSGFDDYDMWRADSSGQTLWSIDRSSPRLNAIGVLKTSSLG